MLLTQSHYCHMFSIDKIIYLCSLNLPICITYTNKYETSIDTRDYSLLTIQTKMTDSS